MTNSLYTLPEVYQSSWIEMRENVAMRYEIDSHNELATLFFGSRNDYAITLGRENLGQLVDLGAAARKELADRAADD